jgi:hypothetical protein
MTATFMEHFSDLKDPRDDKNKKHQLMDILFVSDCCRYQWSGGLGGH